MNFKKIILIGIICFIISNFFIKICVIHGESMYPTLKNNQLTLENLIFNSYNRGDIVVIKKQNLKIVKRIVDLPYDKIVIKDNYVYVNDKKIDNIITKNSGIIKKEITLKKNEYFALGDNRNKSFDSRNKKIGIIKKNDIQGKILTF